MELRKQKEDVKLKYDSFIQKSDFDKASKILYEDMPTLEHEILNLETKINSKENSLIHDSITANDVSEVISKATGIPLEKIVENQKSKLLNLANDLKTRVKGQDHAIDVVANAVLRGRAGINDPNRPIGSFLFMGPTGIGKTELAKALAYYMFDSEKAIVRFDMSEFMEKHSVSKLVGAPPGYVGYEQAGALTEAIRRKPYSVILLDEIEKAHPDVLNLFLQVLDDGQLRDSQGREVNFKNTIIIMTSNIGGDLIAQGKQKEAMDELQKYMKKEFINRIDEIICFNPLNEQIINEIVKKLVNDLSQRLLQQDYNVSFDDAICNYIGKNSYDSVYGARPIKRYIQREIENLLASKILSGEILKDKQYQVSVDKKTNAIVVSLIKPN